MLRPITEYAVPLWHPGLTDGDSNKIEFLQKKSIRDHPWLYLY